MHFDMEENWDVDQKVYETLNMGTILEPWSFRIKELFVGHRVSLVGMGVQIEVWIGGPHRCLGYKRWFLIRGTRHEVYLRKGGIHVFQAPSIVQEHGEEINPRDKLLLENPKNSSSLESMNS
jgi:hypothetical protein